VRRQQRRKQPNRRPKRSKTLNWQEGQRYASEAGADETAMSFTGLWVKTQYLRDERLVINLNKLGESLCSSWAKREKNRKSYPDDPIYYRLSHSEICGCYWED
jgi:hypothetical protein